jgi:hypothetical protein
MAVSAGVEELESGGAAGGGDDSIQTAVGEGGLLGGRGWGDGIVLKIQVPLRWRGANWSRRGGFWRLPRKTFPPSCTSADLLLSARLLATVRALLRVMSHPVANATGWGVRLILAAAVIPQKKQVLRPRVIWFDDAPPGMRVEIQIHSRIPARARRVSRMRLRLNSRPLQSNHSWRV